MIKSTINTIIIICLIAFYIISLQNQITDLQAQIQANHKQLTELINTAHPHHKKIYPHMITK